MHSTQNQTVTYSPQDLADLNRLVTELTSHLDELQIDARQRQKAEAQIATLKAQLSDEPDPVIIKQAGRTLRNVTEGAIGSLLATAAQPTVWVWVHEIMRKLFRISHHRLAWPPCFQICGDNEEIESVYCGVRLSGRIL